CPAGSGPVQVFDEMVNCVAPPNGSTTDVASGDVETIPMFATVNEKAGLSRVMTTFPKAFDVGVIVRNRKSAVPLMLPVGRSVNARFFVWPGAKIVGCASLRYVAR